MRLHLKPFALSVLFLIPGFLFADTLFLKDGSSLEGIIQEETPQLVTIKTQVMTLTIARGRIASIKRSVEKPEKTTTLGIPSETTFEKAEKLYHEGKIREALPFYQKALTEDPNNRDATRRIREIVNKLKGRLISDRAFSIVPISEKDMILSSIARKREKAASQSPFTPFAPSPAQVSPSVSLGPFAPLAPSPTAVSPPMTLGPFAPLPPTRLQQIPPAPTPEYALRPFQPGATPPSLPPATTPPRLPSPFAPIQQTPAPQVAPSAQAGEFRGVWITRFEWPSPDPVRCKENILRYLDDLMANNFNAVLFQVRGQGDVLYRSPFEPWSRLIGGRDPGFDPLQFAIEEAHARGLELHAYVNPYPVWQGTTPPPHSSPEHPYWLYCQPDSKPCLACADKNGQIMKPDRQKNDAYIYFSPGIPTVSAYVRKVVMDIVNRYNVDGIHFDRIRYPGSDYSYDEISRRRFAGEGNPNHLSWGEWQCDQITRFLNDIYGEVASVNPRVKISVAGWGIYNKNRYPGYSRFSSGYHQYYQDTFAWMRKGVIDALVPMIYWDIKDPKPNYGELARDFIENAAGRHVYCANWVNWKSMSPAEYFAQIRLTRQLGGQGNVVFSIGGFERRGLLPIFKQNIYPEPARVPIMPWKANPQTGIIIGKVLRKDTAEPITDSHITLTGRMETYLSSADGFFAILNIPPGTDYRLSAKKNGLGEATSEPIEVKAGQVVRIEVRLGG